MRLYAYLRASTDEQDAGRARGQLLQFADQHGQTIAAWFEENESGATLNRPELFRLIDIAQHGDVLLTEQVDRISRLTSSDWTALKAKIVSKGIRIVALDLPTSYRLIEASGDEFTDRMLEAINGMLLDMLAATARKDYEDRRRRQAQGIAKAKDAGKFQGRKANPELHANIRTMLNSGMSYGQIQKAIRCSRSTISRVKQEMKGAHT